MQICMEGRREPKTKHNNYKQSKNYILNFVALKGLNISTKEREIERKTLERVEVV